MSLKALALASVEVWVIVQIRCPRAALGIISFYARLVDMSLMSPSGTHWQRLFFPRSVAEHAHKRGERSTACHDMTTTGKTCCSPRVGYFRGRFPTRYIFCLIEKFICETFSSKV